MTTALGRDEIAHMFAAAARRVREEHQRLSELDSVGGDGDHGTTMLRVVEKLEQAAAENLACGPGVLLKNAGWSVLEVDGGASSSLFGTFLAGMAEVPEAEAALDTAGLARAFASGLAALSRHTKAQPGDKTMLDALSPAAHALSEAALAGRSITQALSEAARAARTGAEATAGLVARFGRARYLGEKTRGYPDPGAVSVSLILEGFCRALSGAEGESKNA